MNKTKLQDIKTFEEIHDRRAKRFRSVPINRMLEGLIYYGTIAFIRFIEIIVAVLVIILVCVPAGVVIGVSCLLKKKPWFTSEIIWGEKGKPIKIWQYNVSSYWIRKLPLFMYIINGKLSLTGVSIKSYENEQRVLGDAFLYYNRPGIFNLWYIRQSSRIAHSGKHQLEGDYLYHRGVVSDLLLILKTIPAVFYYQDIQQFNQRVNLLGIDFMNVRMQDAIGLIEAALREKQQKTVFFINPDCLNKIFADRDYYRVLQAGGYVFPDGIGINIACKMLKNPLVENVNGTDMLPFLCASCCQNNYSLYLLGAKPGVVDKMKANLEDKYPGLKITGTQHGYFDRQSQGDEVIRQINESGADILLVAFGAPHQEKWILQHQHQLSPKILMGVGGLFDFYSGNIARAPVWMREIGIEWVYRLLQEPKRMWKRYIIGNPLFLFRVMKWKMTEGENTQWK